MAKRLDDMLDSRENVKEKKANCHEPANDMLRINAGAGPSRLCRSGKQ